MIKEDIMAKKHSIDKNVVGEESKEVVEQKSFPVIYYVLIFLTVLSTLFLATAAVWSVGLGDKHIELVKNSTEEAYIQFYHSQYQRDGVYYLGLSGFVLTVGLYTVVKVKKDQ